MVSLLLAFGDFVLAYRAVDSGYMLQFRWIGPRRVTATCFNLVYGVTLLRGGSAYRIHAIRLKRYRNHQRDAPVPQQLLGLADHCKSIFEVAQKISNICEKHDVEFLRTQKNG